MSDTPSETDGPPETDDEETRTERRYRRGVGIMLATLAVLGGWIALLATNAGTNESRAARDATRLASEAQTADIIDQGVKGALEQIGAEIAVFGSRGVFQLTEDAVADSILTLEPEAVPTLKEEATATVTDAIVRDDERRTEISEEADRLSLQQKQVVAERVTWNARASQYETVLTVLAVAIFLVGFTMVVSRGLRPPFVVPGTVLAIVCFGWAIQIYLKPIPSVAPESIDASAEGQVAIDEGRPEDAVDAFTRAVDADDGYQVAHRGLGSSQILSANPDLLRTFAITDAAPAVVDPAVEQLEIALDQGGTDDPRTVVTAAIANVVAADWDRAAELLADAIEANTQAPGLWLTRSAVAIAQGDTTTASESLDQAIELLQPLAGSDAVRTLTAQYLSALEWVGSQEPESAEVVVDYRDRLARAAAEARAAQTPGVDLEAVPTTDVELEIEQLTFADDTTTVDLGVTGLPENVQVIVAVYERPAPGASFVQPAKLFYVGVPESQEGITLSTPRACVPVEYRVDLYVSGIFADSAFSPGGAPTC